jgi:hypothetical protein
MSMRRFFLLAIAALLLTGASVSPAITGIVKSSQAPVLMADEWPMPEPGECDWWSCKVPQTV